MSNEYLLEMNNIEKEYFGNKVLKNVSIRVKRGEIYALIGENGAGKSTVMNILFGMPVIRDTGGFKGEVIFDGKKNQLNSPFEAMKAGIGMVHQEFMLIDAFTVSENIKLGRENTNKNAASAVFGKSMETLDIAKNRAESKATLDRLDIGLNENSITGGLPVGYKQFVEIARELDKSNIKLVVLDEPTAVLTEDEAALFLKCVKDVAAKGISFIFISHRLDEIKQHADRVAILKDGELVGQYDIDDISIVQMSKLMVGREIEILNTVPVAEVLQRPTVLEYKNFTVHMPSEVCRNINLEIKKGEIIGIGGLAGHGKMSLATGVMGLYPSSGEVFYNGELLDVKDTSKTLSMGIVFVSEDRRGTGLLIEESIERNITFEAMRIKGDFLKSFGPLEIYDKKNGVARTKQMIDDLSIRCTSYKQPVKRLSGGNQQKVCLARALLMDADVLFVSEPTRGIDIGAKKLILDLLLKLNRENGMTIVVTSSELAELRSISGRIVIIAEGHIAGILNPDDEDYKFGLLMSGVSDADIGNGKDEMMRQA